MKHGRGGSSTDTDAFEGMNQSDLSMNFLDGMVSELVEKLGKPLVCAK